MNTEKKNRPESWKRWLQVFIFVIFDIVAVDVAYYATLMLRFHFSNQFYTFALPYVEGYRTFAPYYTVCCLLVFVLFKLYVGEWKYAGLSDLNRILLASLVTCAIQVIGTLLFCLGSRLKDVEFNRLFTDRVCCVGGGVVVCGRATGGWG